MEEYKLTIIIPVYNEYDNLNRVAETFKSYFIKASLPSKVLFVNDGSKDKSLELIKEICAQDTRFSYLNFTKILA